MKENDYISPFIFGTSLIVVIFVFALILPKYRSDVINFGLFIATVALAVIAYIQINALRDQANADFILKFNRGFFDNNITKKIIPIIEEKTPLLKENGGSLSDYDLDDFLGYFELMSKFEKNGIIDLELIDETFGHYISLSWQNEEISKYIDELRKDTKDNRYYEQFENLAKRIIKIENLHRKNEQRTRRLNNSL